MENRIMEITEKGMEMVKENTNPINLISLFKGVSKETPFFIYLLQ